jgi:sigma-B regulation protein RsbU (phosphoserine phosphatase)
MIKIILILIIAGLSIAVYLLRRANAQLLNQHFQFNKERNLVFAFLNKIGQSITSELEVEQALRFTAEFIVEETGADSGAVFVVDPGSRVLQARVVVGLFPPLQDIPVKAIARKKFLQERLKKETFPIGDKGGIIGQIAEAGEPLLINNAGDDDRVPQIVPDIIRINNFLAMPLKTRDKVLGIIALVNKRDGTGFSEADKHVLGTLGDQAAVTLNIIQLYGELAEKQRIEQELRVAQSFQQMLLPKTFPDVAELDLYGLSLPALEVGGDYFDMFMVEDRKLGVVIADVSGKGIPGALVMASVRSNIRAESRGGRQPREVLKQVNKDMLADTQESVFITMTYAVIDLDKMTLTFTRAGHEPLISSREDSDQLAFFTPEGIAVGMTDDKLFSITEQVEITLHPNQTIILYTDGVTEAMNGNNEEYGMDRFCDTIKNNNELQPRKLCEHVIEDIEKFCDNTPQYDDITMIALRAKPEAFTGQIGSGKVVEMN